MDTNKLLAAQQYVSSWLVRFDDELFGILYRDINDMPKELATQVFEHKRGTRNRQNNINAGDLVAWIAKYKR